MLGGRIGELGYNMPLGWAACQPGRVRPGATRDRLAPQRLPLPWT